MSVHGDLSNVFPFSSTHDNAVVEKDQDRSEGPHGGAIRCRTLCRVVLRPHPRYRDARPKQGTQVGATIHNSVSQAHHRASRTAQRQLERFHFDERWHAALNASNGIGLQRRLATLAVSRYNSETVRELCIYIRNLTMNLDILLMPIIRHFDRVETVLFVTDADTSTHYGIGVALLSGRHIEKVAIGMESERDAGIQWRDILVAIDSPHFRHLDIRYTDSQFVFTAALAPTMLRQLRILDIDFDPDDVDSILKQVPRTGVS